MYSRAQENKLRQMFRNTTISPSPQSAKLGGTLQFTLLAAKLTI